MELDALALTCRHLRNERDSEMTKLAKQKHAAHAMCHRLRTKIRRLELSNRLLMAVYLATESHNRILRERVVDTVEAEMSDLPALGI